MTCSSDCPYSGTTKCPYLNDGSTKCWAKEQGEKPEDERDEGDENE